MSSISKWISRLGTRHDYFERIQCLWDNVRGGGGAVYLCRQQVSSSSQSPSFLLVHPFAAPVPSFPELLLPS